MCDKTTVKRTALPHDSVWEFMNILTVNFYSFNVVFSACSKWFAGAKSRQSLAIRRARQEIPDWTEVAYSPRARVVLQETVMTSPPNITSEELV